MKSIHIIKSVAALLVAAVLCGFSDGASALSDQNIEFQNVTDQNYTSQPVAKRKRQPLSHYQQRRLRKTQPQPSYDQPFDAPLKTNTFGQQPSQVMRPSGSGVSGSGTIVVPNR